MTSKFTIAGGAVVGLAVLACATLYATAKPYQQDRILITLGLKSA